MTVEEINKCARCGGIHQNLEMKPLSGENPHYTHFIYCPTNNEPILITCDEEKGEEVMIISHNLPSDDFPVSQPMKEHKFHCYYPLEKCNHQCPGCMYRRLDSVVSGQSGWSKKMSIPYKSQTSLEEIIKDHTHIMSIVDEVIDTGKCKERIDEIGEILMKNLTKLRSLESENNASS